MSIRYDVRAPVDDAALTALHGGAFSRPQDAVIPWSARLATHSLTWVTARSGQHLVGFVNVIGDGGAHAVLLDTVVEPDQQGRGIGRRLVSIAAAEARAAGCEWLHVDYEPTLAHFYEHGCGFRPTPAGLIPLT
ncbi:MAG: GNAT family N-acetyltransferase [Mycobacteriales bacterium]